MITATYQTSRGLHTVEVEALINPDDWFGRTLLVMMGSRYYVVEADHEQDALDAIVDSDYGKILTITEEDAAELEADGEEVPRFGNYCEPVCLEGVWFPNPPQCKVTITE